MFLSSDRFSKPQDLARSLRLAFVLQLQFSLNTILRNCHVFFFFFGNDGGHSLIETSHLLLTCPGPPPSSQHHCSYSPWTCFSFDLVIQCCSPQLVTQSPRYSSSVQRRLFSCMNVCVTSCAYLPRKPYQGIKGRSRCCKWWMTARCCGPRADQLHGGVFWPLCLWKGEG